MQSVNALTGGCFLIFIFSLAALLGRLFFRPGWQFYMVLCSAFITFSVSELTLRVLGVNAVYSEMRGGPYTSPFTSQDIGWFHIHYPNSKIELKNTEYNYPRSTNSLGLSDAEFDKNKKPNSLRIIAVGDSYTEGDGVAYDSTWPRRLRANLEKQYPSVPLEVYNAGICGSDPFFGNMLLKEKLMVYHPDIVILTVNRSDMDDYFVRGGMERFRPDSITRYKPHPWYEFPFAVSYVCRLILRPALNLGYNMLPKKETERLIPQAIDSIISIVEATNDMCRENSARLIVLIHPQKFEYRSYSLAKPILDSLRRYSGIEVFDFLAYMQDSAHIPEDSMPGYYWSMDGHYNPRGYTLLGDAVTEKVLSLTKLRLDSLKTVSKQ